MTTPTARPASSATRMTRTALVIGGGIACPVTAMALQKAGFEATVYEAHPERTDGAGGGFTLAPNGLAALDVLGLGDLVRPAGRDVAAYVLQDWKGRPLAEFGNPPGVAPMQFYRRDLYRALHEEAARRGIRVEYGKRLTDVREETGAITAVFGDGTSATADLLVGADGIRSRVRELIDPQAPAPQYAWRSASAPPWLTRKRPQRGAGWRWCSASRPSSATRSSMTARPGSPTCPRTARSARPKPARPRPGSGSVPHGGLRRGPDPGRPPDRPHEPGRPADRRRDGEHAERPGVAPGQDDPGRRLRPRPVVKLRPGRLARPGKRGRTGPVPARPPGRRGRLRGVRVDAPPAGRAHRDGGRAQEQRQDRRPGGRAIMGAAIRVFARLSDPGKAAWMLHYKIDWDAPVTATPETAPVPQSVA